ncbi:MAG: DUF3048 domain-containing protein [Candidatus Falkowbacteria bacterium]
MMEPENKNKKKLWITVSCVCAIVSFVLGITAYWLLADFYPSIFKKPENTPEILKPLINNSDKEICKDCARRAIDGVYVKEEEENYYPVAVVIENHIDARPAFGIEKANFVIEAEAEGSITRFLAVFADGKDVTEIGPIRSARPYFVDWAHELSALFAHCGGSPEALVKIVKDNVFDINEFYNETYFWRDKMKDAPHNIYTSSGKMNEYLEKKGLEEGKFFSWKFKDEAEDVERGDDSNIEIIFKAPDYVAEWEYDKENNIYTRENGNKEKIKAKNVIIQYVKAEVIDDEWRLKMQHIGEGDAVACLDGKCKDGKWRKKTSSSRTRFYDLEENEFEFNAGTTWVEVVRPEKEVVIK